MKSKLPLLRILAIALLSASFRGSCAEFTIENVLKQEKAAYPLVSAPSNDLPKGISAAEDVQYTHNDLGSLDLDIYRPANHTLVAAVLIVHGGGWESGSRQMERPFAKQLALRGYAAIPVSYRLGPSGRFPASIYDLKAAVRWVRAHASEYGIDSSRIGALGGSAGGQLVALLGASNGVKSLEGDGENPTQSSRVQAVVDIDGVADFAGPTLIAQEEAKQGATSRFLGGPFSAHAGTWHAASASSYLSPVSAPCLFINSSVTHPILPGRPEMSARLMAMGIDSKVIVFPNTPHPFWLLNPWFEQVLDDAQEFLDRHLSAMQSH